MRITTLSLATLLIGLMGCSSGLQTVGIRGREVSKDGADKQEVSVLSDSQAQLVDYNIVGKVFYERGVSSFDPVSDRQILKKLLEGAQVIRGDGLIEVQYSTYGFASRPKKRWASGFVVSRGDVRSELTTNAIGVTILPPMNSSTDIDSATMAEENKIMVQIAQYNLEKAGYYTRPTTQLFPLSAESIQRNELVGIDKVGAPEFPYLLLIDAKIDGSAHSVGSEATGELAVYLVSKVSKSIIWQNSTSESRSGAWNLFAAGPIFGILTNLLTNAREEALYKVSKELYDTLPPPTDAVISD